MLQLAALTMNLATHEVHRAGRPISLTVREFELLEVLLREPQRMHSRKELLDRVWGETFVNVSAVPPLSPAATD